MGFLCFAVSNWFLLLYPSRSTMMKRGWVLQVWNRHIFAAVPHQQLSCVSGAPSTFLHSHLFLALPHPHPRPQSWPFPEGRKGKPACVNMHGWRFQCHLVLLNSLTCGLEICAAVGITYVPPLLLEAGVEECYMTMVLGIDRLDYSTVCECKWSRFTSASLLHIHNHGLISPSPEFYFIKH